MMNDKKNNFTLEEYENEFSYTKSKTNLNIEFNRIAFIFFIFLIISLEFFISLLIPGKYEHPKVIIDIKTIIQKLDKNFGPFFKFIDSYFFWFNYPRPSVFLIMGKLYKPLFFCIL